jgi:hypothetical protein
MTKSELNQPSSWHKRPFRLIGERLEKRDKGSLVRGISEKYRLMKGLIVLLIL